MACAEVTCGCFFSFRGISLRRREGVASILRGLWNTDGHVFLLLLTQLGESRHDHSMSERVLSPSDRLGSLYMPCTSSPCSPNASNLHVSAIFAQFPYGGTNVRRGRWFTRRPCPKTVCNLISCMLYGVSCSERGPPRSGTLLGPKLRLDARLGARLHQPMSVDYEGKSRVRHVR